MMMKIVYTISLLLVLLGVSSCEGKFDFSPYAIDFDTEETQVHQRSLLQLSVSEEQQDTLYIAFTGDTHRFYDEFDALVRALNKRHQQQAIDFLVHVGDLADFGLPKQYQWGNSFLLKLAMPYFVVLGNHDLVGNGATAYHEMFGDFDFSFIYKSVKFVFINTNSREFLFDGSVPNIQWLDAELKPNADFTKAVVFFHVPPMDADFDPSLEEAFQQTLARYNNVLFVSHGHLHGYQYYKPYADSIPYVNVYGVEKEKFNVIKISNNDFKVETYSF
ncbi:MAG: metallophosphoesterase [Salinivirgaceae bacterium]|jgi:3',5'-cyclic AMP phosphodiesterase CpdA